MSEQPPKILYKYKPVDKYALRFLARQQAYFNTRRGLNDPFELRPRFDRDCTEASWVEAVETQLRDKYRGASDRYIQNLIAEAKRRDYPPTSEQIESWVTTEEELLESVGIFSACEECDSILMWSHYADSHRGICIGIDTSCIDEGSHFHKVVYELKRPTVRLFGSQEERKRTSSTTKNEIWQYEHEWRLIKSPIDQELGFPQALDMPDSFIVEIILGAFISQKNEIRVLRWASRLVPKPVLSKCAIDPTEIKINRVRVSEP